MVKTLSLIKNKILDWLEQDGKSGRICDTEEEGQELLGYCKPEQENTTNRYTDDEQNSEPHTSSEVSEEEEKRLIDANNEWICSFGKERNRDNEKF